MSVNKHRSHILVIPEDDANRQIANGFLRDPHLLNRQIQILEEAGGWNQVLEQFRSNHVVGMDRYPSRLMVLVIDLDGHVERLQNAKAKIPAHLTERVFILSALRTPEDLRRANLGSYENIGLALAKDCREETSAIWGHELLRHNAYELDRLRQHVRTILFSA
jgi:hypothetical protein